MSDGLRFSADLDFGAGLTSARSFFGKVGGMANDFNESFGAIRTLAQPLIDVGAAIGGGAIQAAAQMETFEAQLVTLMGSSVEARARMEELYQFAADTPFNIEEVVRAETILRGFADTAAVDLMPKLMDFASAMNTDVSQAAIDLGKAWSQGATALESDTGRVLRKQIADLNGWADDTKIPLAKFREGMLKTLDVNFEGGALRAAKTFSGLMSTLQDEWGGFMREIGKAGLFDNVKGALLVTLDYIKDSKAEAEQLAGIISDGIWLGLKGSAYVVGVLLDTFQKSRGTAMLVAGVVADITRGLIESADGARSLAVTLAELSGNEDLAKVWREGDAALDRMAVRAAKFRDEMISGAAEILKSESPLLVVNELLAKAEAAAAAFGAETELGTRKAGAGLLADAEAAQKAAKELEKFGDQYADILADIQAMERKATASTLSEQDKVNAARDEDLLDLKEKYDKEVDLLDQSLAKRMISLTDYYARSNTLEQANAAASAAITNAALVHYEAALEKQLKARQEAAARAEGIVAASSGVQLSTEQQLQQQRVEALKEYTEQARAASLSEQQIAADRAEIIAGYNQQIQDAQVAQAFQTIELIHQNAQQLGGMLTTALDESYTASVDTASKLTAQLIAGQEYYTDAQEEQLKKRIDAERKAGIKAFNISKGIKMADAMMSAGLAAVNAFQSAMATVPYPANMVVAPVSAGIALGMGIAQAAVISQQQPAIAHRGAFVEDLAPDETMIKATRKEVVLSPVARDQIGDETIQRAQAGQGGGNNREIIVVDRYRHEAFNRFAKDNLKMQSPMSDAVGTGGTRQVGR